jgi:uncharacterized membrane protein HdeD (DUF308 family)
MSDIDASDPWLRLASGFLLVLLGTPLFLSLFAPLVVLFVALGTYALIPDGSHPDQRWKTPLVAIGSVLASVVVTFGYSAVLPGSHWTLLLAGLVATGVGTVRLVRAGREV